jgi:urocanate hydratase
LLRSVDKKVVGVHAIDLSCAETSTNIYCKGTYFDYGNAFLLEASRAGADIMAENHIDFKYPSYVQDIMGPMCFDFGFSPFVGFALGNQI